MITPLAIAVVGAASAAAAHPIYGYYPGLTGASQLSSHVSGAYDSGVSSGASPYGSSSSSWNNGFRASQNSYATPYGNSGSSSLNQWSSNAWSNSYGRYPWAW